MPVSPGRRPGGWTLLDLIALIVITGALAVTAVPMLSASGIGAASLDAALERVMGDIRFVQEWAVDHGIQSALVLDQTANGYFAYQGGTLSKSIADPWTRDPLAVKLGTGTFRGVILDDVSFAVSGNEIRFDPTGIATTSGSFVLHTKSDPGKLITVSLVTGDLAVTESTGS